MKHGILGTLIIFVFFAGCAGTGGSSGSNLSPSPSLLGLGGAGGGTLNPGGTASQLSNALQNYPTDNADQQNAVSQLQSALGQYGTDLGGLTPGLTPAQVFSILQQINGDNPALQAAEQQLQAVGLNELAQIIQQEILGKTNVLRYFNSSAVKHFYQTDAQQNSNANSSSLNGYTLEGIAFRVYSTQTDQCSVALYNCEITSVQDDFLSVDPNCESQNATSVVRLGIIGYLCASPTADATLQLIRLWNGADDHLYTVSTDEAQASVQAGYHVEGYPGYTAN